MAAGDEDVEALDRLEGALNRIESGQAARPTAHAQVSPDVMERLDAVIARLRAGLEG